MNDLADGLNAGDDGIVRCWWAGDDPRYLAYHDDEWGRPSADDHYLFEMVSLEGFQAGLSWLTILRKREHFRAAFAGFEIEQVAAFGEADVARLLDDEGIVRHRGKIEATIGNARRCLELVAEEGSLASFVWRYEPEPSSRPEHLDHDTLLAMTTSPEAERLSRDLKRRGWSFVGPTTVYSFLQAAGVVDDHLEGCHARARCESERDAFERPT